MFYSTLQPLVDVLVPEVFSRLLLKLSFLVYHIGLRFVIENLVKLILEIACFPVNHIFCDVPIVKTVWVVRLIACSVRSTSSQK